MTEDGSANQTIERLRDVISRAFLGHASAIDRVLCCLLARGHLLIEDVPGVGKSALAMLAARAIGGDVKRVQMTSDLLPSDIVGVSVFEDASGQFRFVPGPIFANVVIADEVNRAPPRTQSALLEAMNDHAVSIDGVTHRLPEPFMVIATQNPSEQYGVFPLPESQLDRFLARISLGYLDAESEIRVLLDEPVAEALHTIEPITTAEGMTALQRLTATTTVSKAIAEYVRALADDTRNDPDLSAGLSTRGALAMIRMARASARLRGRDYVTTDDIVDNFVSVAAHRLIVAGSDDSGRAVAAAEAVLSRVAMPV
ncbi:MAG: MoxR family ATPase [Planctomycetota bacterium]